MIKKENLFGFVNKEFYWIGSVEVKNFKFVEEDEQYLLPLENIHDEIYRNRRGKIIPMSLKTLGKILKMRSDKLYRLLKEFKTYKIYYQNNYRDDSFYIKDLEDAKKCEEWINNINLKINIERVLFS